MFASLSAEAGVAAIPVSDICAVVPVSVFTAMPVSLVPASFFVQPANASARHNTAATRLECMDIMVSPPGPDPRYDCGESKYRQLARPCALPGIRARREFV